MKGRRERRGLSDRLRDAYFASPVHAWRLSGSAPDALAVPVADAWAGDSDLGRELLEGAYTVAGATVQVGDGSGATAAWAGGRVGCGAGVGWKAGAAGCAW